MKNFIISILLLLPFFAFTQQNKLSFSIEGTVGLSDVFFFGSDVVQTTTTDSYKGKISYDLGVLVNLPLREKLNFQTGLKAVVIRKGTEGRKLRWGTQHDGEGGWDSEQDSQELFSQVKFVYSNLYLEFPLRLNVQLLKKSKALQLSLGQSPTIAILDTTKSILYSSDETVSNTTIDVIRSRHLKFNMNTQIGIMWSKEMKKGKSFYLFPNARIQTFNEARRPVGWQRHLFYGISTGINL